MLDLCKFNGLCQFLLKYSKVLISIFLLLTFIFSAFIFSVGKSYGDYLYQQMRYNIYEYNEVDIEQLCRVANCKNVVMTDKKGTHHIFEPVIEVGFFTRLNKVEMSGLSFRKITESYYWIRGLGVFRYLPDANAYFSLNFDEFKRELQFTFLYTFLVTYAITLFFLYFSYRKEEREHLIQAVGSEAIISNQMMIVVSENIHHEMNTPQSVIYNKVEKIYKVIHDFIASLGVYHDTENT